MRSWEAGFLPNTLFWTSHHVNILTFKKINYALVEASWVEAYEVLLRLRTSMFLLISAPVALVLAHKQSQLHEAGCECEMERGETGTGKHVTSFGAWEGNIDPGVLARIAQSQGKR